MKITISKTEQKNKLFFNSKQSDNFIIFIEEINDIIKMQKKASDLIYQQAILDNFSHEQMNPLNSILAGCEYLLSSLNDLKILKEKNKIKIEDYKMFNADCQNKLKDILS